MIRRMLVIASLAALAACGGETLVSRGQKGGNVDYPVKAKKNLFRHCTKLEWPAGVTSVYRGKDVNFELTNVCDATVRVEVDDSADPLFAAGTRSIDVQPGTPATLKLTVKEDAPYRKYKVNLKLDGKSKDPDFEVDPI